jgi:two-component system, OmpR family, KDP operon response regulator KdpE
MGGRDMKPPRVLLVDEEPQIVLGLGIMLRSAGYEVTTAGTWPHVLSTVIADPPEVLVLDLGVPDGRAVELCEHVRRCSDLPILVLSAVGDERQKCRALDAGADDFLTRPFDLGELLARLRALLQRHDAVDGSTRLEIGELTINLVDGRVARAGEDMHLDAVEFALVRELAANRERLVTDRQLLRAVWGPQCRHGTRELRVLVAATRSKLERDPSRPDYLITETGVGYRLRDHRSRRRQEALT